MDREHMHKRVLSLLAAAIGLFLCAGCMYVPVSQAEGLTGSGAGPAAQTEVQEIQAEEPEAQAAGSVAEQPEVLRHRLLAACVKHP